MTYFNFSRMRILNGINFWLRCLRQCRDGYAMVVGETGEPAMDNEYYLTLCTVLAHYCVQCMLYYTHSVCDDIGPDVSCLVTFLHNLEAYNVYQYHVSSQPGLVR